VSFVAPSKQSHQTTGRHKQDKTEFKIAP